MLPENIPANTRPRRRRAPALLGVVSLLATLVALTQPASAATPPSTLAAGHNLTAGQKLLAPHGAVELVMQTDGNLVAYGGGHALWASGTAGHNGAYASMQTDGNLVVRTTTTALWSTGTRAAGATNHLAMQDDGNVVLYTSANTPVWSTNSHITTLYTGVNLTPGQALYSADDHYRLVMQGDGNLVEYSGSTAVWQSNTDGHPGAYAAMQTDGNLVVRTTTTPLYATGTAGHGANRLVLQTDRNLVLYTPTGTAVWQSHTGTSQDTSSVDGPITRAQVMTRINYWVTTLKPPYNVGGTAPDLEGKAYRTDCSGSVDMAWHLGQQYSTHQLNPGDPSFAGVTHVIARPSLQPGDALVRDVGDDHHISLFVRWADASHTSVVVDEEPQPGQTEIQDTWGSGYAAGYTPIAYNKISG